MKIEEIDAINYKNGKATDTKEKVVKDETITNNKWKHKPQPVCN